MPSQSGSSPSANEITLYIDWRVWLRSSSFIRGLGGEIFGAAQIGWILQALQLALSRPTQCRVEGNRQAVTCSLRKTLQRVGKQYSGLMSLRENRRFLDEGRMTTNQESRRIGKDAQDCILGYSQPSLRDSTPATNAGFPIAPIFCGGLWR